MELMGSSSTVTFLIAGLLYPTLSRFEHRFVEAQFSLPFPRLRFEAGSVHQALWCSVISYIARGKQIVSWM
jgi:hypothetical protein